MATADVFQQAPTLHHPCLIPTKGAMLSTQRCQPMQERENPRACGVGLRARFSVLWAVLFPDAAVKKGTGGIRARPALETSVECDLFCDGLRAPITRAHMPEFESRQIVNG